jgi:hypothetical protein
LGRLAADGQHHGLARVEPVVDHTVGDQFDQRRRLASARPGQDQEGAAAVIDDGALA